MLGQRVMVRGSEVLADVELDVAEGLKEDLLRRWPCGGGAVAAPKRPDGGGAHPVVLIGCGSEIQMHHDR
jgi:hypothetical protein